MGAALFKLRPALQLKHDTHRLTTFMTLVINRSVIHKWGRLAVAQLVLAHKQMNRQTHFFMVNQFSAALPCSNIEDCAKKLGDFLSQQIATDRHFKTINNRLQPAKSSKLLNQFR